MLRLKMLRQKENEKQEPKIPVPRIIINNCDILIKETQMS